MQTIIIIIVKEAMLMSANIFTSKQVHKILIKLISQKIKEPT
jgi:hypothetical protein